MNRLPRIGAFVLETLTTGMYTNALDTIRELVQNASDSIRSAVEEGIISENQGRIILQVNPAKKTLVVSDNGLGVPQHEVKAKLIDIGTSSKNILKHAGFRGIGRLAAIAYCRTLSFRTSAQGEPVQSVVEIDCDQLRTAFSVTSKTTEDLASIIDKNSVIRTEPCETSAHFFEVKMESILESGNMFLDWAALENYLSQTAPVPFDAQRFVYATKISQWAKEHQIEIPVVELVLRTPEMERQVFKPHKTHYKTEREDLDIHVKDICFFPESPNEAGFWIWYGKTDLLGMIGDRRTAGLRLRKNNIALGGPDQVADLFAAVAETNRRFNNWFIGEIHILNPLVIPNARRDGLEETPEWTNIRQQLLTFVRARCQEVREASDARNAPTTKLTITVDHLVQKARKSLETGVVPEPERASLLQKIKKQEEKVAQAIQFKTKPEEVASLKNVHSKLVAIRQELENKKSCYKGFSPQLSRKERKLISRILAILHDLLTEQDYQKARHAILTEFGEPEIKGALEPK